MSASASTQSSSSASAPAASFPVAAVALTAAAALTGIALVIKSWRSASKNAPSSPSAPAASNPAPAPATRKFVNPYAGTAALTPEEVAIIKQTVPILAEHGVTLTTRFYKKIFAKHPALNNVFNQAHQATGMQPAALAAAVHGYAANIENLGALSTAVRLMAHKHASLSILPEQYPVVGSNLLETLDELLVEAKFDRGTIDAVIAAWNKAYAQLANILITEEEKLYQTAESVPGGWRGWRKFVVKSATVESQGGANITSYELVPQDGKALPTYLPGQYTTVRAELPACPGHAAMTQPRQYSLSKPADGKSFRITIKREDARGPAVCPVTGARSAAVAPVSAAEMHHAASASSCPAGRVSTHLHHSLKAGSVVELAPPFGDFTLDVNASTPVVLVGAGVGLTPLVAMADAVAQSKHRDSRSVLFLYAADSGAHHPMKAWMKSGSRPHFRSRVWYRNPSPADKQGVDYDVAGTMDLATLRKEELLVPHADYFVCGPPQFMTAQIAALRKLGVKESQIHAEAFGTGVVQIN